MKKSHITTVAVFILYCFSLLSISAQDPGNPKGYLRGYYRTIKGDDFGYHSPQPNATTSLLIRSMDKAAYVEWETEPVHVNQGAGEVNFIMIAAIDADTVNLRHWDILVNGKKEFTITTPSDLMKRYYSWTGPDGYKLDFRITMTDQFGDLHGYMTLTAPEGKYEKGKPLRLKVEGESANSPRWFMVFKYGMKPEIKLIEEQAVTREGDRQYQQVRIEYVYMGEPADAVIISGDIKTNIKLAFGYNTIRAKLPVVTAVKSFPVSIRLKKNNTLLASSDFNLVPVVQRTIHLLHHSHVDIGYTHVQDEVKQIQWKNLESAVKLAAESKDYPADARFRWNSEVMWPIETYLRENSPEKAKAMRDAISKGWIELDAFYANTLTELCTSAELIRLTADARRIADECGVPLRSAMITDIPGWSWGIVPVLARSGVRYLSLGTNSGDRIGSTIKDWGDRPFWWVSPSGEEKVLCWIHEKAYSLFHTGLKYDNLKYRLDEGKIFGYMNELYEKKYPYGIVTLRYNIGSDNGPTDPTLSDAVKAWNEKYVTPKVKIMTVTESFSEFEKEYGAMIPSVSGAFTGYWEDGAASSALETAVNRKAASIINSAGTVFVLNDNAGPSQGKITEAWRNVLLYDEHTWGSWNSISEPENPFTISQWERKKKFAYDALRQGNELIETATGNITPGGTTRAIEVINTHSWTVSDIVTIPASMHPAGSVIRDSEGKVLPSQRSENGDLVFTAMDVPALGSRIYTLSGDALSGQDLPKQGDQVENEFFRLKIDNNGSVESLFSKSRNFELSDKSGRMGLNSYIYVPGRMPDKRQYSELSGSEITASGPVYSELKVISKGSGSREIISKYRLYNGLDKVVVENMIDKEKTYNPEALLFGFPFRIPRGVMHIDLGFGAYRPEADQLKAACRNYFTPEKWVDISNQDNGVTWISCDAPLIQIGDIATDANAYGWLSEIKPSQTIFSYNMNNYWGTNYKASQEGKVTFRYTIHPHGMYVPSDAEKLAAQESEPLVVVAAGEKKNEIKPPFTIKDNGIVVISLVAQQDGYLVNLFNAAGGPADLDIEWNKKPSEVFFSDFDGKPVSGFVNGTVLPAWAIRTIRVRK